MSSDFLGQATLFIPSSVEKHLNIIFLLVGAPHTLHSISASYIDACFTLTFSYRTKLKRGEGKKIERNEWKTGKRKKIKRLIKDLEDAEKTVKSIVSN